MRKYILFTVLFFLSFYAKPLYSQGLLGGEIRWDCISAGQSNVGKYVFYLKVYQACYNDTVANPILSSTQILHSISPAGNRSMSLAAGYPKDISPICSPDSSLPQTNCSSPDSISAFNGAHRVYVYVDTVAINGVPPPQGWTFSWNGGKRNRSSNLVDSLNPTMRLRSILYPYGTQNAYPCFDYAPASAEAPIVMTCNGYSFHYYSASFDNELDSLVFEWGEPMDSIGTGINYNANRSYLNPLPNTSDNPNNIPATINPYTGEIIITTYTEGGFFSNQKISAFKCGVKVAEIYRDMYFQFYDCGTNVSPVFQPPFKNGTSFVDSIYVGQRVSFNLNFTDSQTLSTNAMQNVKMMAFGSQFGNYIPANGSNPPIFDTVAGCINPPCATLNAAPSDSLPLQDTTLVSTFFSWQTDCGHLATNMGCGNTSNVYSFHFKYWDDYCPVPAYNFGTVVIIVLPKPALPPPQLDSVSVDSASGDATLHWVPIEDSLLAFKQFNVYASLNKYGQYSLLDSLGNGNDSTYLHQGAYAMNQQWFYYIRIISGVPYHYYLSAPSDTVHNNPTVFNNVNLKVDTVFDPYINPNKQVIVKVKNIGFPSIDSIWFSFSQPDSTLITEHWHGYLAPGDSMNYSFYQTFSPYYNPNYQLCVKADVYADIDTTNNRNCAVSKLGSVDLSIEQVWDPTQTPTIKVYALIKNIGYPALDSAWFSYYQPDSTLVKEFWTGYIIPGDSAVYMFNQVFIPSYNSNYTLCVKADVYNDVDLSNNIKCLSVPMSLFSSQEKMFRLIPNIPNPASESTQIRFYLPQKGQVQLQVYDIAGRRIFSNKIPGQDGINSYKMNVSNFEAGVYYYRLEFEGIYLNAKFVVLR